MNVIAGMMIPEMNCARKLGLVQLLVALVERLSACVLPAEHLDERVARCTSPRRDR